MYVWYLYWCTPGLIFEYMYIHVMYVICHGSVHIGWFTFFVTHSIVDDTVPWQGTSALLQKQRTGCSNWFFDGSRVNLCYLCRMFVRVQ
jgi:hypothetical protein